MGVQFLKLFKSRDQRTVSGEKLYSDLNSSTFVRVVTAPGPDKALIIDIYNGTDVDILISTGDAANPRLIPAGLGKIINLAQAGLNLGGDVTAKLRGTGHSGSVYITIDY